MQRSFEQQQRRRQQSWHHSGGERWPGRQQRQQHRSQPALQQQQQERQQQSPSPPQPAAIPVVRADGAASTFFSASSFSDIGATDEVVSALISLGIRRPSHVQAAAYRALLQSGARHVVLADHAGSGKTLAYLLPHLQLMLEEEAAMGRVATQPGAPRLLVVVPTAELAAQAARVCRALSNAGLRHRSAVATGGRPMRTQREALKEGVDVLVGTPGRLLELAQARALSLDAVRAVVLDEVDVLLSDALAFASQVRRRQQGGCSPAAHRCHHKNCTPAPLLCLQVRPLHAAAPPSARFVFVSATIPEELYLELEQVSLLPGAWPP